MPWWSTAQEDLPYICLITRQGRPMHSFSQFLFNVCTGYWICLLLFGDKISWENRIFLQQKWKVFCEQHSTCVGFIRKQKKQNKKNPKLPCVKNKLKIHDTLDFTETWVDITGLAVKVHVLMKTTKNVRIFFIVLSWQGTFIFSVVKYKPLKFNKTYVYPTWAYALGWSLGLFCVLLVPLWIVFKMTQMKGTLSQVCTQ